MKIRSWIAFSGLMLILSACDDNGGGYTSIKGIESLIYQEIKAFRESEGLTGPFVHQPLLVKQAQIYSAKMASGSVEVNTQGIDEHWDALEEVYTFYNRSAVVLKTLESGESLILEEFLAVPGVEAEFLADLTQCGIGVEQDAEDFYYITVLLAKAD